MTHTSAAAEEQSVRNSEGFTVSIWREQIASERTELNIHYPDGRFGFMIRLTDDEKRQLAEALHPALLAARQERDGLIDQLDAAIERNAPLYNQLLAARRVECALRDALTAIANLRPYRDPAYPHISIYELPEIARAALAATPVTTGTPTSHITTTEEK